MMPMKYVRIQKMLNLNAVQAVPAELGITGV
jgi:hypothetical protein